MHGLKCSKLPCYSLSCHIVLQPLLVTRKVVYQLSALLAASLLLRAWLKMQQHVAMSCILLCTQHDAMLASQTLLATGKLVCELQPLPKTSLSP
jgi:hypothetical protein